MRLIIGDTSCLIVFDKIGELGILKDTFQQIVVTDKVADEYGTIPSWIEIRIDYDQHTYQKLNLNFGPGEASCIALAQKEIDPILIIDDRKARLLAEEVGIECIGSLGVLLVAKREGTIDKVKPVLQKIAATDFRISPQIIRDVLDLAEED